MPKVIDFGLAKAMHQPLTEQTLHTAHGMMVGTPLYMSPEQAEFNNLDIDTRTDVYSLGVILYELLTGNTPLEKQRLQHAALQEMLRLIKEEEPPKPSTRLSGSGSLPIVAAQRESEPAQLSRALRGDLDWIVMKSLEKERSRRYETGERAGARYRALSPRRTSRGRSPLDDLSFPQIRAPQSHGFERRTRGRDHPFGGDRNQHVAGRSSAKGGRACRNAAPGGVFGRERRQAGT